VPEHSVPEQSYFDMNGRVVPFPASLIVQVGIISTLALRNNLLAHAFQFDVDGIYSKL